MRELKKQMYHNFSHQPSIFLKGLMKMIKTTLCIASRSNSDVLMLCYNYCAHLPGPHGLQVKQWCPDAMLQLLCPLYNYLALMVCRSNSDVLMLCYNYCAHLPGPHGPQVKQWYPDAMSQLPCPHGLQVTQWCPDALSQLPCPRCP